MTTLYGLEKAIVALSAHDCYLYYDSSGSVGPWFIAEEHGGCSYCGGEGAPMPQKHVGGRTWQEAYDKWIETIQEVSLVPPCRCGHPTSESERVFGAVRIRCAKCHQGPRKFRESFKRAMADWREWAKPVSGRSTEEG